MNACLYITTEFVVLRSERIGSKRLILPWISSCPGCVMVVHQHVQLEARVQFLVQDRIFLFQISQLANRGHSSDNQIFNSTYSFVPELSKSLIPFLNFENLARGKFLKSFFLHLINMEIFSNSYYASDIRHRPISLNLVYRQCHQDRVHF